MSNRISDAKSGKLIKPLVHQDRVAPTEQDYAESLERRPQDEEVISIISFSLGRDEYAFEISDAVEVLRPRPFTEVPKTPDYMLGILSVRGEMIPVIDLKKRLRIMPGGGVPGRVLVTAVEDLKAGFLVDRMTGVAEVPALAVEAARETADPEMVFADFLKGIIRLKGRKVFLLNAGRLIDAPQG